MYQKGFVEKGETVHPRSTKLSIQNKKRKYKMKERKIQVYNTTRGNIRKNRNYYSRSNKDSKPTRNS